ncbi:hypothetical protein [uncultured Methylobacterium sp.]|jgi:hypothetical protein|uniref:hypothetical protein n=1 Tax=uncultured Methylobacterium sp. TaxID=157278 RepID=UPI00263081AE|nr:hypothetical protein [uncultured Methylobacterium sp.]
MRLLREAPLMVLPGNRHASFAANVPEATFDILAFARTVLHRDHPEELLAVVTWARLRSGQGEDLDDSIRAWCREKGWLERTFHRRKDRACERIAAAKNAERR